MLSVAASESALPSGALAGPVISVEQAETRARVDRKESVLVMVGVSAPARGAADALVTVVEAFEFACPACESARPVVEEVLAAYPDDVRIVYKHFIVHPPLATIPAQAACAAHVQGKFAEMAQQIWDNGYKANRNLAAPHMEKLAADIGLDAARFRTDMTGEACARRVREDQAQMTRVGAGGTPTFYVNGRPVQRRSLDEFKRLIDQELAVARQRVAQGTRPADYYKTWIVDKGARTL